jgi:hypothetical protein
VDQNGVLDGRENVKESVPNLFLLGSVFSPEAVLLDQVAASDPCADKIVEIAIRQPFDIQVNGRSFEP